MKKEVFESNPILKLSFQFSLAIISFCDVLDEKKKYVVSRQLLKCGTAICANAMEAQNAESKADFIHKMKLAAKEAEEAQYWLWLCECAESYPDTKHLQASLEDINKILSKILTTAKNNK